MFFESGAGWEVIDDNVQRQVAGFNNGLMMVNVRFRKGGVGAVHDHPHTQATHIAEGVFEVTVDGKKKTMRKGDSFFVMPNVLHGVVCLEDGLLIDAFSPMREDFIK